MNNIKSFSVISESNIENNIILVGVGALGSLIGLNLVRLGLGEKLIVFDCDEVEEKNLNNQGYLFEHIGMPKTEAFKDLASKIDPTSVVIAKNKKVENLLCSPKDIIILAVDSFTSRMNIIKSLSGENLLIVGGINSIGGNIEVCRGKAAYDALLKDYENVKDEGEYHPNDLTPCGSPISIYHRINVAASIACESLIKFNKNKESVKTNIVYDFPNYIFITE